MPFSTQTKLLRVLQHHEVQRVGSARSRKVEVRILAATNRDLRVLSAQNHFRQDLYYRISMVEIQLPPLRQHPDDIAPLARHFLGQFAAQYGKDVSIIASATLGRLEKHTWPGNVREMENVVGNAVMQADGRILLPEHLPVLNAPAGKGNAGLEPPYRMRLHDVQQHHVHTVLEHCSGNKLRAAELLGISRSTLYRTLEAG